MSSPIPIRRGGRYLRGIPPPAPTARRPTYNRAVQSVKGKLPVSRRIVKGGFDLAAWEGGFRRPVDFSDRSRKFFGAARRSFAISCVARISTVRKEIGLNLGIGDRFRTQTQMYGQTQKNETDVSNLVGSSSMRALSIRLWCVLGMAAVVSLCLISDDAEARGGGGHAGGGSHGGSARSGGSRSSGHSSGRSTASRSSGAHSTGARFQRVGLPRVELSATRSRQPVNVEPFEYVGNQRPNKGASQVPKAVQAAKINQDDRNAAKVTKISKASEASKIANAGKASKTGQNQTTKNGNQTGKNGKNGQNQNGKLPRTRTPRTIRRDRRARAAAARGAAIPAAATRVAIRAAAIRAARAARAASPPATGTRPSTISRGSRRLPATCT